MMPDPQECQQCGSQVQAYAAEEFKGLPFCSFHCVVDYSMYPEFHLARLRLNCFSFQAIGWSFGGWTVLPDAARACQWSKRDYASFARVDASECGIPMCEDTRLVMGLCFTHAEHLKRLFTPIS